MLYGLAQIKVIDTACVNYLTDLVLEPEQLEQLIWLFQTLGNVPALKKSLLRLMALPWVSDVPAIIASVFKDLLQPQRNAVRLCQKVLKDKPLGALCYLQVRLQLLQWACLPFMGTSTPISGNIGEI